MITINQNNPMLLVGGDGNIGRFLVSRLLNNLSKETIVTASNQSFDEKIHKDIKHITTDITDTRSVESLYKEVNPGIVVHLAALTNVNNLETNQTEAFRVNAEGTKNLIERSNNIPFFLFSTDFVFDGNEAKAYSEEDVPNPRSIYGKSKYEAEQYVLNKTNGYVIRISYPWFPLQFHLQIQGIKDVPSWILTTLLEGKKATCFTNVIGSWTPMMPFADSFLTIINRMYAEKLRILHVVGDKLLTPYNVGLAVEKRLQSWAKDKVSSTSIGTVISTQLIPEFDKIAPRPEKGNLSNELLRRSGFTFSNIIEDIETDKWACDEDLSNIASYMNKIHLSLRETRI